MRRTLAAGKSAIESTCNDIDNAEEVEAMVEYGRIHRRKRALLFDAKVCDALNHKSESPGNKCSCWQSQMFALIHFRARERAQSFSFDRIDRIDADAKLGYFSIFANIIVCAQLNFTAGGSICATNW